MEPALGGIIFWWITSWSRCCARAPTDWSKVMKASTSTSDGGFILCRPPRDPWGRELVNPADPGIAVAPPPCTHNSLESANMSSDHCHKIPCDPVGIQACLPQMKGRRQRKGPRKEGGFPHFNLFPHSTVRRTVQTHQSPPGGNPVPLQWPTEDGWIPTPAPGATCRPIAPGIRTGTSHR